MKYRNGDVNNDAIREQIAAFESALECGEFIYLDVENVLDMLCYYQRNNQPNEAEKLLKYALNLHPDDTDLLIEQAYTYLDAHKLQEAKMVAQSIREQDNPDVILLNMEITLNEGNLDHAELLLEGLSPMDRESLEVVISIADIYTVMGYPNQALKWLNSVKDRYNDNKKYRLILANAHSEAGNTDVALKIYNSLIDENPYDAEAWLGIAKCYYKEEQFEDAIEPCEYAIAANEDYAEAYSMIANSYLQLENFEKAEEYFKIAIERHSIKEDCGHAFLGLCYTNEEKYSLGREEFETALTLQEENSGMELFIDDIMLNYAICLSETDYRDRACEIIEELLRNNEYDIPVMIAATKIFAGNNRIDEARELAEKIYPLVKDSDNPEDILTLIEIMNDLGMRKESLQASLSLINLLGDDAILFRMLASGHLIEGDFENFCRYNIQATPRYTTEEAYDIHLEACRRLRKEPMDYDEFESMIEETTKRLEEEKLKR